MDLASQTDSSELPEGWAEVSFDQLLQTLESGSRPKGGVRGIKDGIPSIGGEHLDERGSFRFETVKFVPASFFKKMNRGHIQKGDILIVKDGATTGKVSLVNEEFPYKTAVVNEHVFICRPSKNLFPAFLFYFLFSKEGQERILENFRGSAQGGINQSFAPGTAIPLAPLAEQKRIVAKLKELLGRVHSVRERLDRVQTILKRFRQSVLSAACSGRLTVGWRTVNYGIKTDLEEIKDLLSLLKKGKNPDPNGSIEGYKFEIPDTWVWAPLEKIAAVSRGRFSIRPRNDPRYYGGRYPFVQIGDLPPQGGEITVYQQTLNEKGLSISKIFPSGTVLIAIVGATIGNTGILTFDSCCPDSIVAIQGLSQSHSRFIDYFLRLRKLQIREASYASGGQPNINLQTLIPLPVPLPPLAEIQEAVRIAEKLFKLADLIEKRMMRTVTRTQNLTQAILAKAFRGELVATEAELARREGRSYEPASVLLARIQGERIDGPRPVSRPKRGKR